MLFSETGEQYGIISGGCLEEDLQFRATEVIAANRPMTVTYDLRPEDDADWGQGAGCNGKVIVYLERLVWEDSGKDGRESLLALIWQELERGRQILCMRKIKRQDNEHRPVGENLPLLFDASGELISKHAKRAVDKKMLTKLRQFVHDDRNFEYTALPGNKAVDVLIERWKPKDILYIFGAGPDVEPLVERASEFYFSPIIIDPRSSRCHSSRFPKAKELIAVHPETFLKKHDEIGENSFVLIMTHHFSRDRYILNYFIERLPRPAYVGILGPRRRTERLLYPKSVPEWIHSPVGVNIYAEDAEEISISIIGELIQVRNKQRVLERKKQRDELQDEERAQWKQRG